MAKPRYDWEALRWEYMRGHWDTVAAFRRDKGLPPDEKNNYITAKMSGWATEKKNLIAMAVNRANLNLVDDKAEEIKRIRERQAKAARALQDRGLEFLNSLMPTDIEEARKLLVTGLQEERAALGITSGKGGQSKLTQVNVNLPKTKFDELVNGQNFEELLEFIADIRRERVRRTGEVISDQSQANPQ